MQNRYRRLLLVVSVSLWVVVGLAEHARAPAPTGIEFNTPTTDSVPTGITAGPDGALWFSEDLNNKIGRITTDGVITEFPNAGTDLSGITSGPDGALWFTDNFGKIGRITTDGVISKFNTPSGSFPVGILTGPDAA